MNLRIWNSNVAGAVEKTAAAQIIFRQNRRHGLLSGRLMISRRMRVQNLLAGLVLASTLSVASTSFSQTNYYTQNGSQYAIIGSLPGDQVLPDVAISPNGGFVVWQDNITDGSGWGISAEQVNSTLSGTLSSFRVNVQGTNDQENARVALLKNGGAAFVWQGGLEGYQHIYARFLNASNTFLTATDELVSAYTNHFQINPAIATLNNSNVVVVWSSFDQAGSNSLQDVYAKILSPAGTTISNEFLVNQFTNYNQRTPTLAALAGGGFVVAWVSEQEQIPAPNLGTNSATYSSTSTLVTPSVDIYARLYQAGGAPVGDEFVVDTNALTCANPDVAAASDGSFMVAWSGFNSAAVANGWDVYARTFSNTGIGGASQRINTYLPYDQYGPHLSAIGLDYLAVWTSMGQDGSLRGVYGQFIHNDGSLVGSEFRVNTTTSSEQMQPVVASDGVNQFVSVWSGFTGNPYSFDLFAQRYINVAAVLDAMSAPFVYAPFTLSNNIYQPQLVVSWPSLLGISVSEYMVYVDGSPVPAGIVLTNQWTMTAANGLATNSTHYFQVGYVTTAGAHSPLSAPTGGTTWSGSSWGGIPYEWMQANFGDDTNSWPKADAPMVAGGPTVYQVFLSGGTTNPATWLQQTLTQTPQGLFLNWNTQPGATYQVQVSANLTTWSNLGAPRFATGTTDSVYVGGGAAGYYRVVLLRQ
jgi:hypothetical protein